MAFGEMMEIQGSVTRLMKERAETHSHRHRHTHYKKLKLHLNEIATSINPVLCLLATADSINCIWGDIYLPVFFSEGNMQSIECTVHTHKQETQIKRNDSIVEDLLWLFRVLCEAALCLHNVDNSCTDSQRFTGSRGVMRVNRTTYVWFQSVQLLLFRFDWNTPS